MAEGTDNPTPREIFLEIVDLSHSERVRWLDEHVEDPDLRFAVESLLAHHETETGLRSDLAWAAGEADTTRSISMTRLGDFELVRELGRGGMGLVYLARDTTLDRLVALKVLPVTYAGSEGSVARFLREAKAIARLDHPGIVPIYQVGEEEGIHFIAMAYIEGPTLAQRLDWDRAAHKSAGDGTTRRLRGESARRRAIALLIAAIADALDHAHQHDIIHRDVKPSNVLIDKDGKPH